MIQFKTVEDYIEVIAGERDIVTGKPIPQWVSEPIISLARYDVDVIQKMSEQCQGNVGLTERQANLAQKIILKYTRQLAKKNIDTSPVENPVYRNTIRKMDYSCRLFIKDDVLHMKFPYNTSMIESIRAFGKESQGKSHWNPEAKAWTIALTEYNLNWVAAFAEMHKFEIDHDVQVLVKLISEAEALDYKIELFVDNNELQLRNAPESLSQYINDHVGPLSINNVLRLVDHSSILGYTIDASLETAIAQEYGYRFLHLIANRELKVDPTAMLAEDNLKSVVSYAEECGRLPIYIYEPDLSRRMLDNISRYYSAEQIVDATKIRSDEVVLPEGTKVVYLVKPIKHHKIPLLISTAGMIYGGDKEYMVQQAEKIVYCAAEVYNKRSNKGVKTLAS